MGAKKLVLIKTYFVSMSRKMVFMIRVLWVSFFTSLFTLFRFIGRRVFRLEGKLLAQNSSIMLRESYIPENMAKQSEEKEEESDSLLRFRFPTFEEFARENDVHISSDNQGLCVDSDDNSTLSSENIATFDGFVHQNDVHLISDHDHGLCLNSDDNSTFIDTSSDHTLSCHDSVGLKPVEDIVGLQMSSGVTKIGESGKETGKSSENIGEMFMKVDEEIGDFIRDGSMGVPVDDVVTKSNELGTENLGGEASQMVDNLGDNVQSTGDGIHDPSENESLVSGSDSDSDSMVSSNSSFRSSFMDSFSDGVLSEIDFQRAFDVDMLLEYDCQEVKLSSRKFLTEEDIELHNLSKGYGDCDDLEDEDEDILQELKDMENDLEDDHDSPNTKDGLSMESESPSEQSAENQSASSENQTSVDVSPLVIDGGTNNERESVGEDQNRVSNLVDESESKADSEKSSSGEQLSSSSDSDEQNGLEREWEHQDLVEQLKMEIKKVQAIGLPTILEESESPKIMDDLKPWKIEHRYQHVGTMDELHKFYKSYRERMRKLDILNFQKMYAIGFLRLKDPLQSFTRDKMSIPALSAIVSLDCWPCKPKPSSEVHPPLMKKFSKELESDLEMVYVGQMCLSWEFLCWEYGKALELWESDPHGILHYNEVADKFQIFQVLLNRFLEEELFEGPRVQHYVKNRCVFRNLLQVPVVRDDNYRNRKKERKVMSSKEAITSLQLVEIIEESIRILWQLIKTDKDSRNAVLMKYRRSSNVELQTPADANLLAQVRSTLLKKDKKLKELTRNENCILRSIHRHQEDDSDHVLYFFSRVDLKLVSRVLNMPRLSTDQLGWCSDKLNKINFVGKKLHVEVEPSILLFPCS